MNTTTPGHYTLTTKQKAILNLLYRFRFATSEQLSQALNIAKATINKRLKLMMELNYIGRKYEPEYRLLRKHAAYYLLPDGISELKKISRKKYLPKTLRNIRHDEAASESFVEHCLMVFDLYCVLRAKYGSELQFFTGTQMAAFSYFPKKLPDAHIQLGSGKPKLFLVDLLHESRPFFLATRAVMRYVSYTEDNDWPSQHAFPKILLICDTESLQRRLAKKMQRKLEDVDDPKVQIDILSLGSLRDNGLSKL
jgi:predicted transcriptional regulator